MVSNEVVTRVYLYESCLNFCKWAGIDPPMFVLLVLDRTFVSLFNVVLVARLDFFIFSPVGAQRDFGFFV